MENVRFRTINVNDSDGKIYGKVIGKIVVASERLDEKDFRLGFSYWNENGPKRFARKFYQEIARGRMNCKRTAVLTAKQPGVPLIQNIKSCAIGFAAIKKIKWMRATVGFNLV
jgi:hypothetical protein